MRAKGHKGYSLPQNPQNYLFRDSLTTKNNESGLRLISYKRIIEKNHQGKLYFETETRKGTTCHFNLPH